MLWRIENSETYILASVHVMDSKLFQLSASAEAAYMRSKRVVFESDFTTPPDVTRFLLPKNSDLSTQVSSQLLNAVRERAQEAGLVAQELKRFPPWLAALTLMMTLAAKRGFTAANGVDARLLARARTGQRRIDTLEATDAGLLPFALAPTNEQIRFLSYVAEETEAGLTQLEVMVSAWRAGLEKPFEEIHALRLSQAPKLFGALGPKRTEAWVPRLVAMVHEKIPTLVCVGALHCVGSLGLPSLLAQLGHPVSRVD